jgi:hypothetical protein
VRGWLGSSIVAAGIWSALLAAAHAEGIYTCVDAKGRRLTSDRPIIDCIDREQQQLSPTTGQVVRKIGPSLTAEERAAAEEKAKRDLEERNRQLEEKRRDRALLTRFPDRETHEKERATALAVVDDVIRTAKKRTAELLAERKRLDTELEFYQNDMKKAPPQLKRRMDENEQQQAAQARFIANQEDEKKRVNARYDQELARLKPLWAQHSAAAQK